MCLDSNDDEVIIENTFFKIYNYNKYVNDIYNSNKSIHYQLILEKSGFIVKDLGDNIELDKLIKNEMQNYNIEKMQNDYEQYKTNKFTDNVVINNSLEILKIKNIENEKLDEFKDIIINKHKLDQHLDFIKYIKSNEYICEKISNNNKNNFIVNNLGNIYNKIQLITFMETNMNISKLEINNKNINYFELSNDNYNLIKSLFRTTKSRPKNSIQLHNLYIMMIRNVIGSEFIQIERKRCGNNKKEYSYSLNEDSIKKHIELNQYSNPNFKNYCNEVINKYKLKIIKNDIIESKDNYNNQLDKNTDN